MGLGNCPECWDVGCDCKKRKTFKWNTVLAWIAILLLTSIPSYQVYLEAGTYTCIIVSALLIQFWKDQLIN